jgi:uncharacterized membrane-anchored protein
MFYWAAVFATFALGTALGDFTATTLGLGYLSSVMLFLVAIVMPAIAWRLGLNAVVAFWWAYVLTRPLGASVSDYVSKPHSISGLNFGDGRTAIIAALAVAVGVGYLAITRRDVQSPAEQVAPQPVETR